MNNTIASLVCIVVLSCRVTAISRSSCGSSVVASSMLETEASRWKSCSSCIKKKPTSPEDIKLKLQDLKDNVDFHMNNFTKSIKEKFDNIKEVIEPTELEHLKEACEKVEDKIKETQSDIKSKCDSLGEAMESKQNNQSYGEIVKRVENYKMLIKKFVDEGLESLNDDLNKIKQEFSTNQTTVKNSNENTNKDDNKESVAEKTSDHDNMPQKATEGTRSSLVQVTSHEVKGRVDGRRRQSVERREGTSSTYGDDERSNDMQHEEDEKYHHHDDDDHGEIKHDDEEYVDHKERGTFVKKEEQQKNGDERGGEKGDSLNTSKDKSYDVKTKSDKASSTFKMSQETQEAFEFSHIPPTAITRAVKMYLQDLNTEAAHLMREIVL